MPLKPVGEFLRQGSLPVSLLLCITTINKEEVLGVTSPWRKRLACFAYRCSTFVRFGHVFGDGHSGGLANKKSLSCFVFSLSAKVRTMYGMEPIDTMEIAEESQEVPASHAAGAIGITAALGFIALGYTPTVPKVLYQTALFNGGVMTRCVSDALSCLCGGSWLRSAPGSGAKHLTTCVEAGLGGLSYG